MTIEILRRTAEALGYMLIPKDRVERISFHHLYNPNNYPRLEDVERIKKKVIENIQLQTANHIQMEDGLDGPPLYLTRISAGLTIIKAQGEAQ